MKLLMFLIVFLCPVMSFGQKKEMKKAAYNNYTNEYTATFKNYYSKSDINKWCSKNGYHLVNTEEGAIYRFGNVENGIKIATFISKSEYRSRVASANAENARRREIAKKRKEESDLAQGIVLAGLGVLAVKAIGKTVKAIKRPSSSGRSSSSTEANSNSSCQSYTSIHIEIEGELEDRSKLSIEGGPSHVSIKNSYSDVVGISTNYGANDCIAGTYSFHYAYNIGQSDYPDTVSGSFTIDGTSKAYTIVVSGTGNLSIRKGY